MLNRDIVLSNVKLKTWASDHLVVYRYFTYFTVLFFDWEFNINSFKKDQRNLRILFELKIIVHQTYWLPLHPLTGYVTQIK